MTALAKFDYPTNNLTNLDINRERSILLSDEKTMQAEEYVYVCVPAYMYAFWMFEGLVPISKVFPWESFNINLMGRVFYIISLYMGRSKEYLILITCTLLVTINNYKNLVINQKLLNLDFFSTDGEVKKMTSCLHKYIFLY